MNDTQSPGARLLASVRKSFDNALARVEETTGKSIYEHAAWQLAPLLVQARREGYEGTFSRSWPYCFTQLDAGGGWLWLPLNRYYKPLGRAEGEYADYEACAGQAWLFTCDPREIQDVWREEGGGKYWLYRNDGLYGREALEDYAARLGRVLAATGENAGRYFTSLTRTLPIDARPRRKIQ